MAYRFNPAPGWPAPPQGWTPPEGWQPDPAWPPAPEGWEFWVWQEDSSAHPDQSESAAPLDPPVESPEVDPAPSVQAPFSEHDPAVEPLVGQGSAEHPQAPFSGDESRDLPVDGHTEDPVGSGTGDSPRAPVVEASASEQAQDVGPAPSVQAPFSEHDPAVEPFVGQGSAEHPQAPFSGDEATPAAAETSYSAPLEQQWGQAHGSEQAQSWAPGQQEPQQYAMQQPPQSVHHAASAHAGGPAKKKGKGLLVILIVLAVILAAAFAWGLVRTLTSDSEAAADVAPVVVESPSVEPEPVVVDAEVEEPEILEAEEVEAEPEEAKDLKQLATEAGLLDYFVAQEELEVLPAEMRAEAIRLGPSERAEVTTIMVGPGPAVTVQEVGTLAVSEVVRDWQPNELTGNPCPPPAAGNEYIKLALNADTGPALQDYGFTGLELRFFDEAGNEAGYVNSLLTVVCLGEYEAITSDWVRSGGHVGSVLAEVSQEATTLAYSSSWSYGIDDSIYRWELADF